MKNELRDEVVQSKHPAKVLLLADEYLQQMEKMGDDFRLPKARIALKPLLEEFADDLAAWYAFVRSVRDRLPARSIERSDVQEVARKLEVRLTQQQRRTRLNAAIAVAMGKGLLKDEYVTKMAYADKCTKLWIKRRKTLLDSHRATQKRLDADYRREVLDEFWKQIDAEIANGEVPKP